MSSWIGIEASVGALTSQLPVSRASAAQEYHFDFGTSTSPVAAGSTRVTESTPYASGDFGWMSTEGLESRQRAGSAFRATATMA
jgi:fibronectin type 3 domain-containing protein